MRTLRTPLPLAIALLAAALPSRGAYAEVGPGEVAPDFVGKDYFNTEATSLRDQRGRLVFLELFSTT